MRMRLACGNVSPLAGEVMFRRLLVSTTIAGHVEA
jgi:hypothetical protein